MPQTFKQNEQLLKQNFINLQRENHPDKLKPGQQALSSSEINYAYKTLKSAYDRGFHLLDLLDANSQPDENSSPNDLSESEFLFEIYEFNEAFDEAIENKDVVEFKNLLAENELKRVEYIEKIDSFFEKLELDLVKANLEKLKYYESIKDRAHDIDLEGVHITSEIELFG